MNATEFESPVGPILRRLAGPIGWLASVPHIALIWVMVAGIWLAYHGISRIPEHYIAIGRTQCQAATNAASTKAVTQQAADVASSAASAISRATTTGHTAESSRARINAHFTRLATEARHDPIDPVDSCVLPADRLRRWADANRGDSAASAPDQGATTAQPDHSASAPATTRFWPHIRLGGEPSGRRPGLSPAGQPALQPARVPGDATR